MTYDVQLLQQWRVRVALTMIAAICWLTKASNSLDPSRSRVRSLAAGISTSSASRRCPTTKLTAHDHFMDLVVPAP
ncbi:hypothetical protein MLP_25020 [Microlunatus phosphovorus NM-1]|uniref:Uncharacterized protein n=1 Tax=Microlunatus phosphovorus (strain ATCC 700054 / DSM 10555 / JCM 9379 / NBRC 101784 / NCIMB 13414 / VKM Ac-1990 / NM-1) TaxID=1032480 RepID=F5XGN4_MICPN|nr:hypothetical protein MLP_25020 [Microlunatus phosphovorus NM-1]